MTNMRAMWRTGAVASCSGPTMKPGVSHRNTTGTSNASQQLQEARGLVGAVGVDRAAEVGGVVGDDAERPALDPGERGDHPVTQPAPQLEHRAGVAQRVDDACARRRPARGSRGRGGAACAGRRTPTRRPAPGSTTGTAWRRRPPRLRPSTATSTTPFAHLHAIGPIAVGSYDAEAAALDHRRAAHADVRVGGGDDHVAAAEERGVAGEAVARVDADERHEAAQLARSS